MAVFAVLSSLLFLLDPMAAAADAPKVRRGTHPALGIYFMLKLLLGALIFSQLHIISFSRPCLSTFFIKRKAVTQNIGGTQRTMLILMNTHKLR
jgi:hypothetical protein